MEIRNSSFATILSVTYLILSFSFPPASLFAGPKLEIKPEIRPTGEYASFLPDTTAKAVTYIGLSGADLADYGGS